MVEHIREGLTAVISVKPRYQSGTGIVFLDDSQIQEFQLQGISPEVSKRVTKYGSILVKQTLERAPIYAFKNTPTEKMARMSITDVKVVGGKLRVMIDPTMQQMPKTAPWARCGRIHAG